MINKYKRIIRKMKANEGIKELGVPYFIVLFLCFFMFFFACFNQEEIYYYPFLIISLMGISFVSIEHSLKKLMESINRIEKRLEDE